MKSPDLHGNVMFAEPPMGLGLGVNLVKIFFARN